MSVESLLSSCVIAAIISGMVSFFATRKQGMLQYITGERKEWRDEIRKIASSLNRASYKKTLKLLTELKVRINAFGNKGITFTYSNDAHIWKVINEIECEAPKIKRCELILKQQQLIEYLSLLLKYDWERSKKEVKGDIYKVTSLLLTFAAGIYVAISLVYLNKDGMRAHHLIPMLVGYALIIVMAYFLLSYEVGFFINWMLDGNIKNEPKKHKIGRLFVCYFIEGLVNLGIIFLYIEALNIWLDILSCGENELVISAVSSIIFFTAQIFSLYSKIFNLDRIYNYSNAINVIRIKYQENISK